MDVWCKYSCDDKQWPQKPLTLWGLAVICHAQLQNILLVVFIWFSICFPCEILLRARSSWLCVSGWILIWTWNHARLFVHGKTIPRRCVVLCSVHPQPALLGYGWFASRGSDVGVCTAHSSAALRAEPGVSCALSSRDACSTGVAPRPFGAEEKCCNVIYVISSLKMRWAVEKNKPEACLSKPVGVNSCWKLQGLKKYKNNFWLFLPPSLVGPGSCPVWLGHKLPAALDSHSGVPLLAASAWAERLHLPVCKNCSVLSITACAVPRTAGCCCWAAQLLWNIHKAE